MGIFDRPYSAAERQQLAKLQSRINVARALLEARATAGLTQEEVGRLAGTKQSRVSEIEGLKGNPRFDTLDRMAAVLGLMVALVPRVETQSVRFAVNYGAVVGTAHVFAQSASQGWPHASIYREIVYGG